MDESERIRLLCGCALFADLPDSDLRTLAAATSLHRYRRGQILFVEGDSGDSLLMVADGRLKAYSTSPDGDTFLLVVLEPGESLGEVTIADGGPRSATVEALTEAVVLRLPREAVLRLAAGSSKLTSALLVALASVVRRLTGTAADLVFLDLPRRVAKLVLEEHQATGSEVIEMPLTQAEIADRVGASRQSVNAALRDFQRRGWLETSGHVIQVRDVAALTRFVGM